MAAAAYTEVWSVRAGAKPRPWEGSLLGVTSMGRVVGRGSGAWRSTSHTTNNQPARGKAN